MYFSRFLSLVAYSYLGTQSSIITPTFILESAVDFQKYAIKS